MKVEMVEIKKLNLRDSQFFVPLDDLEIMNLEESVGKKGILVPLTITNDYNILDGRNRFLVAESLNLKKVPCEIIEEDLSENQKDLFMIECNLRRRQLTEDLRIKAEEKLYDLATNIVLERRQASLSVEPEEENKEDQGLLVHGGPKVKSRMGRPLIEGSTEREIAKEAHLSKSKVHRIKEYKKAKEEEPDLAGLAVKTTIRKAKERKMTDEEVRTAKYCQALINDIVNYLKQLQEPHLLQEVKIILSHFLTSESLRNSIFKLIHQEKQNPPITKNISEELIMTYKRVAGFSIKDRIWNKVYFPRYIKDAKLLMEITDDDITKAKKAIETMGVYYENEGLSWTLRTIANNYHKFETHPEYFKLKIPYAVIQGADNLQKQFDSDLKELDARIEGYHEKLLKSQKKKN